MTVFMICVFFVPDSGMGAHQTDIQAGILCPGKAMITNNNENKSTEYACCWHGAFCNISFIL
jgi:hypothetical protein